MSSAAEYIARDKNWCPCTRAVKTQLETVKGV